MKDNRIELQPIVKTVIQSEQQRLQFNCVMKMIKKQKIHEECLESVSCVTPELHGLRLVFRHMHDQACDGAVNSHVLNGTMGAPRTHA